jgi:hypothetical protein
MADPKLHVRGHTASQLVLRVITALEFDQGMNLIQTSGLERFKERLDSSPENVTTEEDDLVGRYFNLFDALFFERSLRYVVTTKIVHVSSPTHTCCKGIIIGGRLVVMVEKSSRNWKYDMLGRLLHDMIHVYLCRYGKTSFVNTGLFEKGWGFSGHGTAWQDIATLLDQFLESYGLLVPLGRIETLRLELESFSDWVSASFLNRKSEIPNNEVETSQITIKGLQGKLDNNEFQRKNVEKHQNCTIPHCYQCSPRGQPIMIRRDSKKLTKSISTHVTNVPIQEMEGSQVSVNAPAHITNAQVRKRQVRPVSVYALEVREFLMDSAETYAGVLGSPSVGSV